MFRHFQEKSILVFVDGESVDVTVDMFRRMGFVTKALYKELFEVPSPSTLRRFLQQFEEGKIQVVVANEETSRGINFPFLSSVYLTFVPDTAERYVHLAGRCGRLGQRAQVVTLIEDPDDVDVVQKCTRLLNITSTHFQLPYRQLMGSNEGN